VAVQVIGVFFVTGMPTFALMPVMVSSLSTTSQPRAFHAS
jgi:hypothetical protein